jgi:hypothetical protein
VNLLKLLTYDGQPVALIQVLPNNPQASPDAAPDVNVLFGEQYLCESLSPDEGKADLLELTTLQVEEIRAGKTPAELGFRACPECDHLCVGPCPNCAGQDLILVKQEANPENENAVAWFAYFCGTPSQQNLLDAFRSKYPKSDPEEAMYEPVQVQDKVADAAGYQRWFLCQAV